ncbi:hypothetical protein E4U42_007276 [Claviceps africana]|uniref:Vacuolar protein-sorting-associated protein 25 n=1 Tax=Claviceps africana TaxID=83212 RepID=A0A8K0JCA6_9HYPO|nr:hypothetical protein E4U42_007276 [Claviceps africana]
MSSPSPFPFPREYHFPPFFTPQPNLTTRHAQQTKWSALILAYARHHRIFRLSVSTASETDLFYNARINRRLSIPDIHTLINFMRKDGRAEYESASRAASVASGWDVVFLHWKKPEEWAALIEKYVEDTAQKGSVLTVYEIKLHGLDHDVLLKALNILVKKGRAQIFGSDDSLGVKFF